MLQAGAGGMKVHTCLSQNAQRWVMPPHHLVTLRASLCMKVGNDLQHKMELTVYNAVVGMGIEVVGGVSRDTDRCQEECRVSNQGWMSLN